MKVIFYSLSVLIFSSVQALATCKIGDIVGNYKGLIASGGGGGGSRTRLTRDAQGQLTGSYFMTSDFTNGTLTDLSLKENTLSGNWHDHFGTGTIKFEFSQNCQDFSGNWIAGDKSNAGLWSGTKIKSLE